jgi:hypothetical protein
MTLGCLQSFHAITVPGQTNVAIFYYRGELDAFIDEQFRRIYERCWCRRGIKRTLLLRRRAVLEYFREPLDSTSFIPRSPHQPRPVLAKSRVPEWNIRRR